MTEPVITEAELVAALDTLPNRPKTEPFSDMQLRFLAGARERNALWAVTAAKFNELFGTAYTEYALKSKYHAEKYRVDPAGIANRDRNPGNVTETR